MQFEEFDNKAKEAADHHHPAYDEQAWAKMEKLLNKHLPQKEDNRRRFLFFLLLFLGLAGAGLMIAKPWKSNKAMASTEQTVQQKQTAPLPSTTETGKEKLSNDNAVGVNNDDIKNSTATDSRELTTDLSEINQPVVLNRNKSGTENINKPTPITALPVVKEKYSQPITIINKEKQGKNSSTNNTKTEDNVETAPVTIAATSKLVTDIVATDKKQSRVVVADKSVVANTTPATDEPVKVGTTNNESEPAAKNKDLKSKSKNRKGNSFFFTLSTGPDVSFVSNDKLGTTKILAGAGLGYTFNNRFTLRTGFYSARKVYTASPDAYHPPANFYTYYPYLEKVDADCKVYEIPISISYNFSRSTKQSWFATAGISSYLMKEETYNYSYKYTPSGSLYNYKRTLKNENKHLFSALTLSGGYQRNIGKHISIMAEPYLKLPLSGVGYGKVKLNSGGVLFSIGIKPFGTKKEKATVSH
jgi:hypothetical protein